MAENKFFFENKEIHGRNETLRKKYLRVELFPTNCPKMSYYQRSPHYVIAYISGAHL
jgi:hypothetical protein